MFVKTEDGKFYILKVNKDDTDSSGNGAGDTITVRNMTGATIEEGDKIWINFNDNENVAVSYNKDSLYTTTITGTCLTGGEAGETITASVIAPTKIDITFSSAQDDTELTAEQ